MAQISCNRVSEIGPQHIAYQAGWAGDWYMPTPASGASEDMLAELRRERERISA